jgi:hypothetical protein
VEAAEPETERALFERCGSRHRRDQWRPHHHPRLKWVGLEPRIGRRIEKTHRVMSFAPTAAEPIIAR